MTNPLAPYVGAFFMPLFREDLSALTHVEAQLPFQLFFRFIKQQDQRAIATFLPRAEMNKFNFYR